MENKKYLNEEKYQQINKKVKKTGIAMIIIGIVVVAIGIFIVLKYSEFGAIGIMLGGFSCFAGLVVRFFVGNQREINAYFAQQSIPVAKEKIEEMAPTIGNVAKEVAKGIENKE